MVGFRTEETVRFASSIAVPTMPTRLLQIARLGNQGSAIHRLADINQASEAGFPHRSSLGIWPP
jgi:hypothetical protein